MQPRFSVAKMVLISPDSVNIEDWFVMFWHRASSEMAPKFEDVSSVEGE